MIKVLITGATSGLGLELSRLMAQQKIPLILTGRNVEKLNNLQKELTALTHVECFQADLMKSDDIKNLCDYIDKSLPTHIVNNAGIGYYAKFEEAPFEKWEELLKVDLQAPTRIAWQAIKSWTEHNIQGCLINVASVAAFIPMPYLALYSAIKSFLLVLSQGLEIETQSKGISIGTFCPGELSTKFRNEASEGKMSSARRAIPVKKAAKVLFKQILKQKSLIIYNWRYRFLAKLNLILPRKLARALTGYFVNRELAQVFLHSR